jgi:hypothetical protein
LLEVLVLEVFDVLEVVAWAVEMEVVLKMVEVVIEVVPKEPEMVLYLFTCKC